MKCSFSIKNKSKKAEEWLNKHMSQDYKAVLDFYGRKGVERLMMETPKDTGLTASSWNYSVIQNGGKSWELKFYNTAHPELDSNIILLIEYGHATRTGGYVPPKPFVKRISKEINKELDKELKRRLIDE